MLRLCFAAITSATVFMCACRPEQGSAASPGEGTQTVVAVPSSALAATNVPLAPTENPQIQEPPADRVVEVQTLPSGDRVTVITYVHTYPEPVESHPSVWWNDRWFYNVGGNFVFGCGYAGGWCTYWGVPQGLAIAWNWYYPWAPYAWNFGYYGYGWYWGGWPLWYGNTHTYVRPVQRPTFDAGNPGANPSRPSSRPSNSWGPARSGGYDLSTPAPPGGPPSRGMGPSGFSPSPSPGPRVAPPSMPLAPAPSPAPSSGGRSPR